MRLVLAAGLAAGFTFLLSPQSADAIQSCSVDMYSADQMTRTSTGNHTLGSPTKSISATRGQKFGSAKISKSQTCRVCEREGITVGVKECQGSKGRYFGYVINCTKNNGKTKITGRSAGIWKKHGRECP